MDNVKESESATVKLWEGGGPNPGGEVGLTKQKSASLSLPSQKHLAAKHKVGLAHIIDLNCMFYNYINPLSIKGRKCHVLNEKSFT